MTGKKMEPAASTNRFAAADSVAARLYKEGLGVMPGGTSRHFYTFAPHPIYAASGQGCWLTDVDGDRRIDCLNNQTTLIHGHADPDVGKALIEQVARGWTFSEPSVAEIDLARLIVSRVPSVEQVHFRNSGTEAVMMAIKLARAFTGRDGIAKFEGGYHGYYDYVQMSIGSTPENWGDASTPQTVPSTQGLAQSVSDDVLTLPVNDKDSLEQLVAKKGDQIAALLVEPLSNRAGMTAPADGFYDFLREITRHYGIVLIFDEIVSFRVATNGAQGCFGGAPDLTTFGKVIGGGLPIGAIGGRREILELLSPTIGAARVVSGGTFSGNPLSASAGLATLNKLTAEALEHVNSLGQRLRENMNEVLRNAGQRAQVKGFGSLFQIIATDQPIEYYRSLPRDPASTDWLARLHKALLESGVVISTRGLGCLSTAMDWEIIDDCTEAFERAVHNLR